MRSIWKKLDSHRLGLPGVCGRRRGRAQGAGRTAVLGNYKFFYALYEFCNRMAWGGTLPPCKLSFNCSPKPSRVAGFASPERPYPRLCLNLSIVARGQTASGIPILLHEMTHIWQFASGRRGGHGRDFRTQLLNVGVDEAHGMVRPGSPAEHVMYYVQRAHPEMAARWFAMVGRPPKHQRDIEQRIFNEYLAARSRN